MDIIKPTIDIKKLSDIYMTLYKKYNKLDIIKLYNKVKSYEIHSSLHDSIFLSNLESLVTLIYAQLKTNPEYIQHELKKLTKIKRTSSINSYKNYTIVKYIHE